MSGTAQHLRGAAARAICSGRHVSRIGAWTLALLGMGAAHVGAGTLLSVTVRQPDGKPFPGVVVMLHPLDRPAQPRAPLRATMDQANRAFVPDVLAISVGSTVSFPNTDKTRHQVYSFSAAHRFQLPLYRGKPYPPELFDRVGIVTLGCNIHDSMLAYIVVTDAERFGVTAASGTWSAGEVAHGRYRLELWNPRLRESANTLVRQISIPEGERYEEPVTIEVPLRPVAHPGRPHSWDTY
jgi:plastocyanin